MKRPAVFFDRDNTLIACDGYLGDPDKVRLIPGAADAVGRARMLGYATVIFSNQSGVARGLFDEAAVGAVNARLARLLLEEDPGAVLDDQQYCPYHPRGTIAKYAIESDLRKPQPGMIFAATEKLALDLRRSWVIGDAPRDIEAGHAAGCRTILFNDPSLARSPAALEAMNVHPEFVCSTLAEAMDFIAAHPDPPAGPSLFAEGPVNPTVSGATIASAIADVSSAPAVDAPPVVSPPIVPPANARLEQLLEALLHDHRRAKEHVHHEFSVTKLLAGIVQVLVLAILFYAYLAGDRAVEQIRVLWALAFESLTIALLIMGHQR